MGGKVLEYEAKTIRNGKMLDGELRETQTANYFTHPLFSNFSPVDCAVPSANA